MIKADDLLASVKRAITIPASQALLGDTDFFAMFDEVIGGRIVPLLESIDEEWFVISSNTALTAGVSEYAIPYRAIGRGLRDVKLVDNNNNRRSLAKIALEDSHQYEVVTDTLGFYFKGDKIHLVPDVSDATQSSLIEFFWRCPPNKLVSESSAAKVASISDDVVTVTSVPSTMTAGVLVDFCQAKSGSSIYSFDQTITNVAGTQITFGAGVVPDDLAVGDYIALAGYSPVVNMVPNEALSLIRSLASYRVLVAIGDFEGAKVVQEDAREEEKALKSLLQPRIDGEPTVLINRRSLVRGNKYQQRRWVFGN